MAKKKRSAQKKAKKRAVKPKIEVIIKKQALGEAPEEYSFILADGKKLKNLFDLASALNKMTDDVFAEHVTKGRNDFSTWINDIFKMPDLAKEVSAMKNKMEAELCVLRKLVKELEGGNK